jgi:diguanylate cyclase (GGDEF)-like protein
MNSSKLVQIYLAAMLAALVAAALYTYLMIDRRQESLESFSRSNVAYSASEAAIEFQRLEKALLALDRVRTPAALDEAKLRYEILYNRAAILNHGEFRRFASAAPSQLAVVMDLRRVVGTLDSTFAEAATDLDVGPILASLAPLEPKIIGLAAEASRYGTDRLSIDRQSLLQLHRQFSTLSFALIIGGLCLVGALTWHNRLLTRAHRELSNATADLKRTAEDLAAANLKIERANLELRRKNERLQEKEQALQAQNVLFDAALNHMSQGLCMFNSSLRPIVCNRRFAELFQLDRFPTPQATGSSPHLPALDDLFPDLAAGIAHNIRDGQAAYFETERADGRIVAVALEPMGEGSWVATFEDVTDQRRAHARIAHMARHDGLTNLPNRYAFRERMQEALAESDEAGRMLAVMCVDVDNFKSVNDSLGHPTGDALLCAVAERLVRSVRETDMVARFGGDEFAILQPRIARIDDADRLANRLIDDLRKPFLIDGELVYASASIGIALAPKHGNDPDILQKNADLALYAAKTDGKRTYRFFETVMDERLTNRHVLERDLRRAIAADELLLYYQPIVDLRTMRPTGFEALLRWKHPIHGLTPPSTFIPIAEEAGLIHEIGRWVLAQACADASRWPSHLRVAVNLSVAQFAHGDIVEDIRAALSRAGLRPERLTVEITESLLLTESIANIDTLHRLKALNIEIAMDDFGTGYSSLNYLRKFSFDQIKIDRDFVSTARSADKNVAIIHAIVRLGQTLAMTTVAEGIETQEDLDVLREAGCEEGQGYLFSRPVPREKVAELIDADACAAHKASRMAAA